MLRMRNSNGVEVRVSDSQRDHLAARGYTVVEEKKPAAKKAAKKTKEQ